MTLNKIQSNILFGATCFGYFLFVNWLCEYFTSEFLWYFDELNETFTYWLIYLVPMTIYAIKKFKN